MKNKTPKEIWKEACEKAINDVANSSFEDAGNTAIITAEGLLSLARRLKGVACSRCNGYGKIAYSNTSTWHHGIGGQMITEDVCEYCWGTGRRDVKGPDLRKINSIISKNELLKLKNIELIKKNEKFKTYAIE